MVDLCTFGQLDIGELFSVSGLGTLQKVEEQYADDVYPYNAVDIDFGSMFYFGDDFVIAKGDDNQQG